MALKEFKIMTMKLKQECFGEPPHRRNKYIAEYVESVFFMSF